MERVDTSALPAPRSTDAVNTSDTALTLPLFDRNSLLNIALIAISLTLGAVWNPLGLLLWPGFLILEDILYFGFGRSLLDTEVAVQRGYQFAHVFLDRVSGHGRDLGFNLYDGELTKTGHRAQTDKWAFMFAQLGLKPGHRLIDIGCGYGDWLDYARGQGVDVVGVNISLEQANYAKTHRGLEIVARNWKDISGDARLREQLFGQFDAVTFMDTIEHYVPSTHRNSLEKQGEIYRRMFELAARLLRPQARPGRVFISCLHQNDRTWGLQANVSAYFLTRYHSGFYPMGRDGLTRWSCDWFDEEARWDKTEDYRLTGVLDRDHFQAPKIRWSLRKLCMVPLLLLCDPHHFHKWIEIKLDAWMRLFGERRWDERYDPQFRQKVSYVILWWLLLERSSPVGAAAAKRSAN
ncbi:MAG: class I SAM-dependent methyltransferase [Burkholderiaceae bacterium]